MRRLTTANIDPESIDMTNEPGFIWCRTLPGPGTLQPTWLRLTRWEFEQLISEQGLLW